ncbi:MAG: VOC family protein [Acidobacteriota bacterium]
MKIFETGKRFSERRIGRSRRRKLTGWRLSLVFLWFVGARLQSTVAEKPPIDGQVVFLYYTHFEEASDFYRLVMGFEETFALDWVRIFRTRDGAFIGLVDIAKGKGFFKKTETRGVMISLTTQDVDGWHRYLQGKGVKIGQPPADSKETGIRSILFSDPGGYKIEIFKWLDR